MNKKVFLLIGFLVLAFLCFFLTCLSPSSRFESTPQKTVTTRSSIAAAYENKQSNIQVAGTGIVSRLLGDDVQGSRHQKFILLLPSGHTLLVAHNIDLAPRIDSLHKKDKVSFSGEYEWNERGGVLHWTHKDPRGRHADGWLRHQGILYQ